MRINSNILCLPASILLLVVASRTTYAESSSEDQSLAQWPKHVRYWPEDPPHRRRDLEVLETHIIRGDKKVGVMKMSPDPGEKFYPEYWQYEETNGERDIGERGLQNLRRSSKEEEARMLANISAMVDFRPPFALHSEVSSQELKVRVAVGRSAAALAALQKRQFSCPTGTNNCASIGYPNSCCPAAESCFQIQDTGLGPVGCCPTGRSCSGTISVCNSPNLACPQSLGGGCCIPGFSCEGVGCVINIVTTILVTQTFPSSSTTSIRTSTSTTSFTPPPAPVTTTTSTSFTCRSDSNPCPSSLGGGCCHTDRVCASSGICALPPGSTTSTTSQSTSPTTIITGGPPIRPTSELSTATGPILTTDCPVYFYACSARYGGGCCQTGRDCAVISCPPTTYTTIIDASRTVVVPVGLAATVTSPTGACASGWATCAPDVGGNCCPSGYQCGTASCTFLGPSGTGVEQKKSPNTGSLSRDSGGLGLVVFGVMLGLVMI